MTKNKPESVYKHSQKDVLCIKNVFEIFINFKYMMLLKVLRPGYYIVKITLALKYFTTYISLARLRSVGDGISNFARYHRHL